MIRDKKFYKEFLVLAAALILEQMVVLSVNLADNVMLGGYDEIALAGVAAVNQIQFVLQQIAYGISSGLIILSSQYWGQKRTEPICRLTASALLAELVLASVLFAVVSIRPEGVVGIFVEDAAVIRQGAKYLAIVRFSYFPFVLTAAFLGVMRSVETVKLALVSSLVGLVTNCGINFVLIFGRFGAPELGAEGAAIGTLIARCLECALVVFYVLKKDKKLQLRFSQLFTMEKGLARDFFRVSSPVALQNGLWGVANAMQTAILGHMTVQAMTAYDITSVVYRLLAVAAVGASTAASILIGHQIGRGDKEGLKKTVNTLQVLFLLVGLLLAGFILAVRKPLLSMYDIAPETYALANRFILIKTLIIFTMSYQMPVNTGIIRGGGDTRYGVILDFVSIWCIVLPVSYFAAFHWGAPPEIVVFCLNADQIFKGIPAAIYGNSCRWAKSLTR